MFRVKVEIVILILAVHLVLKVLDCGSRIFSNNNQFITCLWLMSTQSHTHHTHAPHTYARTHTHTVTHTPHTCPPHICTHTHTQSHTPHTCPPTHMHTHTQSHTHHTHAPHTYAHTHTCTPHTCTPHTCTHTHAPHTHAPHTHRHTHTDHCLLSLLGYLVVLICCQGYDNLQ